MYFNVHLHFKRPKTITIFCSISKNSESLFDMRRFSHCPFKQNILAVREPQRLQNLITVLNSLVGLAT